MVIIILLFLSYKWEDREYVNGLEGLLNNPNNQYRHLTDREREDHRSQGERAWKDYIRNKIRNCDALICLIGQNTHNATGVIYELEVANSMGIKIIPVRIPETTAASPNIIRQRNVLNWNAKEINDELSRN